MNWLSKVWKQIVAFAMMPTESGGPSARPSQRELVRQVIAEELRPGGMLSDIKTIRKDG